MSDSSNDTIATVGTHSKTPLTQRFQAYARTELATMWAFIRAPHRHRWPAASRSAWLRRCVFVTLLTLLLEFPLVLLIDQISSWAGFSNKLDALSPLRLALYTILVAPLLEELIMRAGLRNARYSVLIGPCLAFLYLGLWHWSLVLGLLALIWQCLPYRRATGAVFEQGRLFIRYYPLVFWGYILAFGLLHVGNYEASGAWRWLTVFFVLPQVITGIALSYLRLRDGIKSSWLMHALFNSTLVTLTLLSQ